MKVSLSHFAFRGKEWSRERERQRVKETRSPTTHQTRIYNTTAELGLRALAKEAPSQSKETYLRLSTIERKMERGRRGRVADSFCTIDPWMTSAYVYIYRFVYVRIRCRFACSRYYTGMSKLDATWCIFERAALMLMCLFFFFKMNRFFLRKCCGFEV